MAGERHRAHHMLCWQGFISTGPPKMVNVRWSWLVVSSVAHIEDCIVASCGLLGCWRITPDDIAHSSMYISHHITSYCGCKKSYTTLPGWSSINNGINHLSIPAVVFFHPQYHIISLRLVLYMANWCPLDTSCAEHVFVWNSSWMVWPYFVLEEPLRLMVDAWISKGFEENYANLYEAWWKWVARNWAV